MMLSSKIMQEYTFPDYESNMWVHAEFDIRYRKDYLISAPRPFANR